MRIFHLATLLSAMLAGADCAAAKYYVDNIKGDDTVNDGKSSKSPLLTIAKAMPLLAAGDTLILARNNEPYRESLVFPSSGAGGENITLDGGGATVSGLDSIPSSAFTRMPSGLLEAGLVEDSLRVSPPMVCLDGLPLPVKDDPAKLKPGQCAVSKGMLVINLPLKSRWPLKVEILARDRGIVIDGKSNICLRNLSCEEFRELAIQVSGAGAQSVRLENVEARSGTGAKTLGLSIADKAAVSAFDSRFMRNAVGVSANGASLELTQCSASENTLGGIELGSGKNTIEDCRLWSNGLYDVKIVTDSLPITAHLTRCLFKGGSDSASALLLSIPHVSGDLPTDFVDVEDSVFIGAAKTALVNYRGGRCKSNNNLFKADNFMVKGKPCDLKAFQKATGADKNSAIQPKLHPDGPWNLDGKPIGPVDKNMEILRKMMLD